MSELDKRSLYRVAVKIMFLFGILALFVVLIGSVLKPPNGKKETIAEPLLIDVSKIPYGQIHSYRWNNRDIGVLHLTDAMLEQRQQLVLENSKQPGKSRYFVFYNSAGDVGCPLAITQKSKKFFLHDICSRIAYDLNGKRLKLQANVKDLAFPPFTWESDQALRLGI
jgi:Rieske Fe-S protein